MRGTILTKNKLLVVLTVATIFSFVIINIFYPISRDRHVYAATATWDLNTSSEYTYDNTKIEFSAGSAQLKALGTPGVDWMATDGSGNNWSSRRKVTFDNRDSYLGVTSENLIDFPVLVKLTSSNVDYSKTQDAGQDLRFTDSDGATALSYEIEKWDESGTSYVWVKVPQIDINSNTDYIYFYYGNSTVADGQSKTEVWDSNFRGVWHLNDAGPTNATDSTTNGYTGTQSGGVTFGAPGKIGPAASFDGSNDYIGTTAAITSTGKLTMSGWFYMDTYAPSATNPWYGSRVVVDSGGVAPVLHRITVTGTSNGKYYGQFNWDGSIAVGNRGEIASATTAPLGSWHFMCITYDQSNFRLYIDGSQDAASPLAKSYAAQQTSFLNIGKLASSSLAGYWDGYLDEIRASDAARSAAWVAAEFKSGSDDAFRNYGTETTFYSAASPAAVPSSGQSYSTLSAFSETLGGGSTGTIKYQVSPDNGSTWYWYTAGNWVSASSGYSESNSASDINTHFADESFNSVGSNPKVLKWKAYFYSNGLQQPQLDSLTTTYIWDTAAPNNPTLVTAKNQNGGETTLTSNNWYNYPAVDLVWDEPSDNANEGEVTTTITGYYVYFGTTADSDPYTTRGIATELGGSGIHYQTNREFTVATDSTVLEDGKTYYFRVETVDAAGNIAHLDPSDPSLFIYKYDTTLPDPLAYANVSPAGCSTQTNFTFSWPAASDRLPDGVGLGKSDTYGYDYKLSSSGTVSATTETEVTVNPYQDEDNVIYIRTKDNAGNVSNWIPGVFCVTGLISIVDGPTVTAGPSSIIVDWTSSKATTGFVQVYDGNTYVSEQGKNSYSVSHNVQVVGLKSEKQYRYKLTWSDQNGNVGESGWYETNTTNTPQITNLNAQIISMTNALISWQTNYQATCSIEYGLGSYDYTIELPGYATSFSYNLDNLLAGTNYQLRIKAQTFDGSEFSTGLTYSTPPLPLISGIRVQSLTDKAATGLKVNWSTNIETTSSIFYNQKGEARKEISLSDKIKEHEITIDNLADNSIYELFATGTDQYGNTTKSDTITFTTPIDTRPPKVDNISTESSNVGSGKNDIAQITVGYTTDESAECSIEYGEGISGENYSGKATNDGIFETNHLSVVSDLKPQNPYHFRINCSDKAGNTTISSDQTVISGEITQSVFSIILKTLNSLFGWAKILIK